MAKYKSLILFEGVLVSLGGILYHLYKVLLNHKAFLAGVSPLDVSEY